MRSCRATISSAAGKAVRITKLAMMLWELREARTRLKEQGVARMDEDLIFQAYRKLRTLEDTAKLRGKRAARLR